MNTWWRHSLLTCSLFIYQYAFSCSYIYLCFRHWHGHNCLALPAESLQLKTKTVIFKNAPKKDFICMQELVLTILSMCRLVFCSALFRMGRNGWGGPGSWKEQRCCQQLHPTAVLLQEWHQRHRRHLGRGEEESVINLCMYVKEFCLRSKIKAM